MAFISDTEDGLYGLPWWRRALGAVFGELAAQRERLILWIPVFLGIGIGLYFSLKTEPPAFLGLGTFAIVAAVWGVLWPVRLHSRAGFGGWLVLGGAALVLLGFCSAQLRTDLVHRPVLTKDIRYADVTGRVIATDRLEEGKGMRLILDNLTIEDLAPSQTPERVRIKVRQDDTALHVGDRVKLLAGLKPPSAPVTPGGFDFQRYAYFKKIGAFGFAYHPPEVIERGRAHSFSQRLESLRNVIRGRIESGLHYPYAAIATALMTGERTGISEHDWDAMRASGLAHMLAISGLHVGLIASVIFMAVRFGLALIPPLALRHPIKKYAAVAALLGALFYTLIVGASIPAIRALLMTGIVLFAIMIDRVPFSLRLVAIAASCVLLFLPESLLGASFQMSFAAVTGLIFFYEQTRPLWGRLYRHAGLVRRLLLYFIGVCATTVIATLATAPLALFHFQQLAVYSVISNLFAVPLMAFVVMPGAVVSYLLMPFGLEQVGLNVMGAGIKGILSIADGVTQMPLSTLTPAAAPLPVLVLFTAAALIAVLWKGWGRMAGLVPAVLGLLLLFQYVPSDILVSANGKLMAVRDQHGQMWVSSKRSDRFTAAEWAQRLGLSPDDLKAWADNPAMTCGEGGCRTVLDGRRVAFALQEAAQAEDCAWADIVIAPDPLKAKPCRAAMRIGFFDLWRNGAYALYPDGKVSSVAGFRGHRPWTVSNGR